MSKRLFDLFLDESGCFEDERVDTSRPTEVSLVGGLLIDHGLLTDELIRELLPQRIHCCEQYKKSYLDALQKVLEHGGRLVVFENRERLKVVNGDTTYLNIVSEGLVKLLRDLSNENNEGVETRIVIATRKAMNASKGIITASAYRQRLEEKIMMALGRNHVNGCEYKLEFQDARYYRQLDFADIICNTWLTRKRSRKFTPEEQQRISKIYEGQLIYPVFEDAMTVYLKQLMLERHYGEAIYQVCTLKKLIGFTEIRNQLIKVFLQADYFEQKTWLSQMSLLISQYNKLKFYNDGIMVAENYKRYFLEILAAQAFPEKILSFWQFDTDYYLLTMYDHIGNAAKCQEYLTKCKQNIDCINRSWEHIDYYFGFSIRELNVLMGRYAFEEVLARSEKLIEIFTEARDLFSLIKTYNGTEQDLRSELLGKTYGVRIEAMINLLHKQPQLFDEALRLSDLALAEFDDPRDISRQYQWRCLLMATARKPDEAYQALLQALDIPDTADAPRIFIETTYSKRASDRDFLLWHYTNVMLLLKEIGDPREANLAKALIPDSRFPEDVNNENKKGHPWNLVLWNMARYARAAGNQSVYRKLYKRAMDITRENKVAVTMMTFSLSMSADRLLWCMKQEKDLVSAENEFSTVCREVERAGLTEEMENVFCWGEISCVKQVRAPTLKKLAAVYLK